MLRVAFLLLGASIASALLHDIGPCNVPVTADSNFDFEMFSQESKGVWTFVKVPVTQTNHNLIGMFQTSKSTGKPGEYHTTIYGKNKGEQKYSNLGDATVVESSSGHLIATSRDGKNKVYKASFLKYVPGRYAYFTVCSDEGGK
ncbi:hypothetical protein J6590_037546 [Homalodisca vitripennis]|nr:hypothetical protein J6590_037546 [Homalodisca vitripennis]